MNFGYYNITYSTPSTFLLTHKCNQNILSEFIHPCSKKRRRRGCLGACALDVCAENFSHSCATILPTIPSVLYARLVPSGRPYIESWHVRLNEMHALVVMHRWTLYENVDSVKIKVPFYTTYIDILHVASMHRIVIHCIDIYRSISMNRYTPNTQLDYNWNGSRCKSESEGCVVNVCVCMYVCIHVCVYVYINLHCNIISVLIFFVSPWEFENPWYTVYVKRICKAIDGYFFSRVLLMFAWWQVVDLVIILQ